SSRRRHTRFSRDWSSDVCSSDLPLHRPPYYRVRGKRLLDVTAVVLMVPVVLPLMILIALVTAFGGGQPFYSQLRVGRDGKTFRRSEERRVGKGGGARREEENVTR